jgi:hypothetical protein
MTRQYISHDDAMRFNEHWDRMDKIEIQNHMDRLGVKRFYIIRSQPGKYVACQTNEDDRVRMYIQKGYIEFSPGNGPAGAQKSAAMRERFVDGWTYVTLSTHRPHGKLTHHDESDPVICPGCNMALPATGRCDDCD